MVTKVSGNGFDVADTIAKLAAGNDVIDLSRDDSAVTPDPKLISIAEKYLKKKSGYYSLPSGDMELRKVIAGLTERDYSHKFNPETEITVTSGALQAVYTAISALAGEGDEVVVIEPAHPAYFRAIIASGARPVYVALKRPDYLPDWDAVQKVITGQTKLIVINSPHNPTGKIFTASDLERLHKITLGTNISIVSDESFSNCVFEGYDHQSVVRFPQLMEKSLVVFSFGKSLNISGWKIGYCLGPEKLTKEFRRRQQVIIGNVNTPLQLAIAEYLNLHPEDYKKQTIYQENRDMFLRILQGSKFQFKPSLGTYFQLVNYASISEEKDIDFSIRLIKKIGVATFPLSLFYHDAADSKELRVNLSVDIRLLEKAAKKLSEL
jgi:methionine transaminase